MYQISKDLDLEGFSIHTIEALVKRNNFSLTFSTSDYFLIYIAFKETVIIVDKISYTIPKGGLAFIAPHKNIVCNESCFSNMIIAFSSSFYEKSTKDSFILNSELFFNINSEVIVAPAIGDEKSLKNLIVKRLELYKKKEHGIYIAVAHNCVEILLLDGLLVLEKKINDVSNSHSSYLDTVNRFRILLQKFYKAEKTVSFYSEILCVSPQRLSVMTKTILGKGAKKLVVEKVATEAMKLIENTTLNISEIANELGFDDEANFSNFVKKNLGKSPSEIRSFSLTTEKITN